LASLKLPLDAKRHPFLCYEEAVQNILKNSQTRHAYICISDVDDKLVLEISDDGIGLAHAFKEQDTPIRLLVKRSSSNLPSSLS